MGAGHVLLETAQVAIEAQDEYHYTLGESDRYCHAVIEWHEA